MLTQKVISKTNVQERSVPVKNQYSLLQILGIWFCTGAPMWILGWLVYPKLSAALPTLEAGLLRLKLLTVGLVWQFILSMLILYREEGNIRWNTIRHRFRLNHPVGANGETKKALWWWIVPALVLVAVVDIGLRPTLIHITGTLFPLLAEPAGYDGTAMFAPALRPQFVGAWGIFGLFLALGIFNTFLGEEFIFRGVLLPKMEGVFGKWDWVANAVIFGFYHLHQPWGIMASILTGLLYAFTARRFRSTWFSIILHSGQTVFTLFLILGLVLGLA